MQWRKALARLLGSPIAGRSSEGSLSPRNRCFLASLPGSVPGLEQSLGGVASTPTFSATHPHLGISELHLRPLISYPQFSPGTGHSHCRPRRCRLFLQLIQTFQNKKQIKQFKHGEFTWGQNRLCGPLCHHGSSRWSLCSERLFRLASGGPGLSKNQVCALLQACLGEL